MDPDDTCLEETSTRLKDMRWELANDINEEVEEQRKATKEAVAKSITKKGKENKN